MHNLLVIADPKASFLSPILRRASDIQMAVTDSLDELKQRAPEADAILYADFRSDLLSRILPLAKRLRWIHSFWTGVEGILTRELLEHPAILTNGRGVFREPLADWVAAAMLYFAFDFRRLIRQQEQRVWQPFVSGTLRGRTLGIVGYGAIGKAIAGRARQFGMKIAALRRRPELFEGDSPVDQTFGPPQLNELMAASDYVVVVTPLTPETRGMIGEEQIAALKPTAVIVNIGRGPVIDEAALIRALEAGRLRGAALDVFTTEPLASDHPFWRMSNVLLSPHTADRVEGFLAPACECFFENLNRFVERKSLLNVVDKHAGY